MLATRIAASSTTPPAIIRLRFIAGPPRAARGKG
jgi:hypothetical protein